MKPLKNMTLPEKAAFIHPLFPDEIPPLLEYLHEVATSVKEMADIIRATWNRHDLTADQWFSLCEHTADTIEHRKAELISDASAFAFTLFQGETAKLSLYGIGLYLDTRRHPNSPFKVILRTVLHRASPDFQASLDDGTQNSTTIKPPLLITALKRMTTLEKAELFHHLFPTEMEPLVAFILRTAEKQYENAQKGTIPYTRPDIPFDQWRWLLGRVIQNIEQHYHEITRDREIFAFRLFKNLMANVVVDILFLYLETRKEDTKLRAALILFFVDLKDHSGKPESNSNV
ncbi:hypothetical protein [Olivibacter domesticus]|uniref:Uncharacterized protein n=1 Tax=Olivibacter domesticus TaxID=407022 RepID=A0A1H7ICN8_OLID1|nr:hypothetical protein [Olivibacter domesticus]SEK60208.1 hypothetical protein SAMN05661044_00656 [Olivibacter domesticus]